MNPTVIVESLGVVFGLASVYFATKEDNRTWSIGMLNAAMFGIMFFVSRLYINVMLQVIYILYNGYGWYMWLHGGQNRLPPAVTLTPRRAWLPLALAVGVFTALFGWIFASFTDNRLPYWDAVTVALSLVAQWMLTRKWLENWGVWICANLIYIGLGLAAANYQFAALQVVYIILSTSGFLNWRKELRAAEAGAAA